MNELFVEYLIAKLLRMKGFNGACLGYFNSEKAFIQSYLPDEKSYPTIDILRAPLWQQMIDWLHDEKRIEVNFYEMLNGYWRASVEDLKTGEVKTYEGYASRQEARIEVLTTVIQNL